MKRSRPFFERGTKNKTTKYSLTDGDNYDDVDDYVFGEDVPSSIANISFDLFSKPVITAHQGDPIDLTSMSEDDDDVNEELCLYPGNTENSVSIYERDLKCLLNKDMLNDSIIDFYLRYLDVDILKMREKYHFYSAFFFPQYMTWGYDKVKKWTNRVDIFDCDYVFLPMQTNAHWRLLILCHPGKIADKHFILILDSLGHKNFKGKKKLLTEFEKYLSEEWRDKHPHEEPRSWKFSSCCPTVPGQSNSYDCGLFIMKYAEAFCTAPPKENDIVGSSSINRYFKTIFFSEEEIEEHRDEIHGIILRLNAAQKATQNVHKITSEEKRYTDTIQLGTETDNVEDDHAKCSKFEPLSNTDPESIITTDSESTKPPEKIDTIEQLTQPETTNSERMATTDSETIITTKHNQPESEQSQQRESIYSETIETHATEQLSPADSNLSPPQESIPEPSRRKKPSFVITEPPRPPVIV